MQDNDIAGELRAAATVLREAAKVATAGPWKASPVWSPRSHAKSAVYSHAHNTGTAASEVVASGLKDRSGGIVQPGNAVWIATVDPGLAEPLADWLESCATHAAKVSDPRNQAIIADQHALAVARAINSGVR